MPLEKKPKNKKKPQPLSFRLSIDAAQKLKLLSAVYEQSQAKVIEELLTDAYAEAMRRHPKEVAKLERDFNK